MLSAVTEGTTQLRKLRPHWPSLNTPPDDLNSQSSKALDFVWITLLSPFLLHALSSDWRNDSAQKTESSLAVAQHTTRLSKLSKFKGSRFCLNSVAFTFPSPCSQLWLKERLSSENWELTGRLWTANSVFFSRVVMVTSTTLTVVLFCYLCYYNQNCYCSTKGHDVAHLLQTRLLSW